MPLRLIELAFVVMLRILGKLLKDLSNGNLFETVTDPVPMIMAVSQINLPELRSRNEYSIVFHQAFRPCRINGYKIPDFISVHLKPLLNPCEEQIDEWIDITFT